MSSSWRAPTAISRVSRSARSPVALADRLGDLYVQGDGGRVGVLEHDLVMGAAGQDLRDDVAEAGEHLVAGGLKDHPVERDVVDEIALQLMAARGGDHAQRALGELARTARRWRTWRPGPRRPVRSRSAAR